MAHNPATAHLRLYWSVLVVCLAWAAATRAALRAGSSLAEPVAKPLEGGPRHLVGYLGVDLHGDRDLRVPEDMHCHARVDVERGQERSAGTSRIVHADTADTSFLAASVNFSRV